MAKKQTTSTGDDLKVTKNDDGTITVDGKSYIVKDSYNEVAKKARERKDKLEKLAKVQDDAKKKQLEEEGKWKELAEKREQEKNDLEAKLLTDRKVNAIKEAAQKAGAQDATTVAKLIDDGDITVNEDGTVDGESITKVLDGMKESQPFLFGEQGEQKPNVGNPGGGAPDGGTGGGTQQFYRSQLQDSAFYSENRDAILEAEQNGQIVDDINGE